MRMFWFPVFATLLLGSCAESSEETAIKEDIQRVDEKTSLNLDVKLIELVEMPPITGNDSLRFMDSLIAETIEKLIRKHRKDSIEAVYELRQAELELKYETNKSIRQLHTDMVKLKRFSLNLNNNILAHLRVGDISNHSDEANALLIRRSKYLKMQGRPLALRFTCKYRFNNPLIGGVEQVTSKTFILDTLKTRVLSSL